MEYSWDNIKGQSPGLMSHTLLTELNRSSENGLDVLFEQKMKGRQEMLRNGYLGIKNEERVDSSGDGRMKSRNNVDESRSR